MVWKVGFTINIISPHQEHSLTPPPDHIGVQKHHVCELNYVYHLGVLRIIFKTIDSRVSLFFTLSFLIQGLQSLILRPLFTEFATQCYLFRYLAQESLMKFIAAIRI